MNKTEITLNEAQQMVDDWIHEYGVRYFSELTNMAVLTEEVGELARIMSRKYGDQSFKEGESQDPADEMADVLWVLLCLATRRESILRMLSEKILRKRHQETRTDTRIIQNYPFSVFLTLKQVFIRELYYVEM